MKKKDFLSIVFLVGIISFLLYEPTQEIFKAFNGSHPYIAGFLKFAVLATFGDLLAGRIVNKDWIKPKGLFFRSFIWGFLGVVIVLIFKVYAIGIKNVINLGLLPGKNSQLAFAFFTSAVMNLTFAPSMMAFHRFTDTYADLKFGLKKSSVSASMIVTEIDWKGFVTFVIFKTVPLFWIPAHTITFLLPAEFRVLMAAFLSIALGAILSFAKK